jgi:hypothetical protein
MLHFSAAVFPLLRKAKVVFKKPGFAMRQTGLLLFPVFAA